MSDLPVSLAPITQWRVTLRCGCTWRVSNVPDLARPRICGVEGHGLVAVIKAERVEQ